MLTQTALAVFLMAGQFELGAPQLAAPASFPAIAEAPADAGFPATVPIRPLSDAENAAGTGIRPISDDSPLAAVDPDIADLTVALLRDALQRECPRPLAGHPVPLASVLAASTQRTAAAEAYWQLAGATATYQFSVEETDFLFGLAEPQDGQQQAVLAALRAAAKADEARARLEVLQAQHALVAVAPGIPLAERQDHLGLAATGLARAGDLPLPADLPFVGTYETHHDKLQARGLVSEQLTRIHATLPALHELLRRQAEAVFASGAALSELQQGYGSGRVALGELLDSFRQLQRQRREFVASMLEYNEAIARYAFAVASPALPASRVVGMLIEGSGGERSDRSVLAARRDASSIRRVSNEEPLPAASPSGTGPR